MNTQIRLFALLAVSAMVAGANAQNLRESFSLSSPGAATPSVSSSSGRGYASTFSTFTAAGGYNISQIRMTGVVNRASVANADLPSDNRISLWKPGTYAAGAASTYRMTPTQSSWGVISAGGTLAVTATQTISTGFNPGGVWTYDMFNWFDDAPTGLDGYYESANLDFYDDVAPAPTATNLGTYGAIGDFAIQTTNHAAGQVAWYKFTINQATSQTFGIRLHTKSDSTLGYISDTEIAIYNATGSMLYTNDDIPLGISFPTNQNLRSYAQFGGAQGISSDAPALAAGTYYVAVAGFNASFGSAFSATTTSTNTGNIQLSLEVVPEPASMTALAIGALALVRRRRAK